ncbi:MAG: hypothetical protein CO133_02425, partial [Candidatus Komeilibacteria bacterium CG_4_9_14_3_um_filter_37_5]
MSKYEQLVAAITKAREELSDKTTQLKQLTQKKEQSDEEFVEQLAQNKLAALMTEFQAIGEDQDEVRGQKIDEILLFLATLADDEKLVLGKYLYGKKILSGCQGTFGYKSPTSCGGCHRGKKNVELAGVQKFINSYGDRVYGVPKEVFEEALARLKSGTDYTQQKALQDEIVGLRDDISAKRRITEAIAKLVDKGESAYEQMEDFVRLLARIERVTFADCDRENHIGLVINDETYYRAGCEYGVTFTIYRDGNSKSEYFKWRDGYSASNDDPGARYEKAEVISVDDQKVSVKLESSRRKINRTFDLPKTKESITVNFPVLSDQEQKDFTKRFRSEKQRLLDLHWRKNGTYPDYINFRKMSGQLSVGPSGREVPYSRSEVAEELVRADVGRAVLVIKAQIDAAVERGKQHEWVVYLVTSKETRQLTRDCAYEAELE